MKFNQKPSDILGDLDTYTAFCFDEACLFIIQCFQGDGKKDGKKVKLYFDEDIDKIKENSQNFLGSLFDDLKARDEVNKNGGR